MKNSSLFHQGFFTRKSICWYLCSSVTKFCGFCVVFQKPVDLNKSFEDEHKFIWDQGNFNEQVVSLHPNWMSNSSALSFLAPSWFFLLALPPGSSLFTFSLSLSRLIYFAQRHHAIRILRQQAPISRPATPLGQQAPVLGLVSQPDFSVILQGTQ